MRCWRLWSIEASSAAAEGPPAGRHGHPDDAHHEKKSSSTDSKLSLCSTTICSGAHGRVDGPVEHHGPHVGGEHLGVGGPEQRAVGVAEERELRVTEGLADPVEVPGRVDGPDEGEHLAAHGLALLPRSPRRW